MPRKLRSRLRPDTPALPAAKSETAKPILTVKNIEVIYDHVILVLKGVSLEVPDHFPCRWLIASLTTWFHSLAPVEVALDELRCLKAKR